MRRIDRIPNDIVEELRSGRITPEEASEIFDDLIDAFHAGEFEGDWRTRLGMTMDEASVPLHGRPWLEAVAIRARTAQLSAPPTTLVVGYVSAAQEWSASDDAEAWVTTIGDGLDPSQIDGESG